MNFNKFSAVIVRQQVFPRHEAHPAYRGESKGRVS